MRNNGFLSLCALFPQYYLVLILTGCIGVEGRYLRLPLGYDNDNSVITIVTYVYCFIAKVFSSISFCLTPLCLIGKASIIPTHPSFSKLEN